MISKQKAKRVACGIAHDALTGCELAIGQGWDEGEKKTIEDALESLIADLLKKSL